MMNRLPRQTLVRCVTAPRIRLFSSSNGHDGTNIPPKGSITTATDQGLNDDSSSTPDDVTEWVPPDRPLAGDMGQTFLYDTTSAAAAAAVVPIKTDPATTTTTTIDWLSTRRQALSMELPDKNRRFVGAELEVKVGYLLSNMEINTCLTNMGALHVKTFADPTGRLGGGVDGIFIATATSTQHLQLLSDTLVRQLKVRKLADRGVVGAKLGAEGTSSDWNVIDCHNYVVHIMLEETRRHLNLEALWSGEDELLKLRLNDEDTVDDYVAKNPVPDKFGAMVEVEDMGKHVSQLQKWNMEHKAVITKPARKAGSKVRRSPRLL